MDAWRLSFSGRRFFQATFPFRFYKRIWYVLVEAKGKEHMSDESIDVPQGTLDVLILKTVALEPQHGWAIAQRVSQMSSEVLQIQQGSLYPALHRLERKGWIRASWGASDNNRRAKYYEITRSGRRQLDSVTKNWQKLMIAVSQILEA